MKSYKIILISVLILTSCAIQKSPQYKWVKSSSNNQEKEYAVADSKCTAEAYKTVPIMPASDCRFMSGFSRGTCQGSAMRDANNAEALRDKIYSGCMLGNGWEKHSDITD